MTEILELPASEWDPAAAASHDALQALERGGVLWFPNLRFELSAQELALMSSPLGSKAKNVSLDPARGEVRGVEASDEERSVLQAMMSRFGRSTALLLAAVLPKYRGELRQARISYRPSEIEGRTTSWRKDDTRLHVDSFPSSPTHGTRILRVFTNVNPHGKKRVWRLGESFEGVARRFLPQLKRPWPGSATARCSSTPSKRRASASRRSRR